MTAMTWELLRIDDAELTQVWEVLLALDALCYTGFQIYAVGLDRQHHPVQAVVRFYLSPYAAVMARKLPFLWPKLLGPVDKLPTEAVLVIGRVDGERNDTSTSA